MGLVESGIQGVFKMKYVCIISEMILIFIILALT